MLQPGLPRLLEKHHRPRKIAFRQILTQTVTVLLEAHHRSLLYSRYTLHSIARKSTRSTYPVDDTKPLPSAMQNLPSGREAARITRQIAKHSELWTAPDLRRPYYRQQEPSP